MLSYSPVSMGVVENSGPDAEELITNSLKGGEKGVVVVNNSDLDRKDKELDDKKKQDQDKDGVEGCCLQNPNTSRIVSRLYLNGVDIILHAIA